MHAPGRPKMRRTGSKKDPIKFIPPEIRRKSIIKNAIINVGRIFLSVFADFLIEIRIMMFFE